MQGQKLGKGDLYRLGAAIIVRKIED